MKNNTFTKKNYRFLDHVTYYFIWLFLVIFAHAIFYGGGTSLQVILANHGWWVFDNLNLPIDKAIAEWGAPALKFFDFVGTFHDLITIAFSLVVYVFLGRKYFTYWAKTYIFMHALAFLIFILFPVYYTPLDATVFVQKTYQFSNFGELPSFHNLNIQIFIFIILLAKIKKEKYEKQVNILIYVALVVLLFLAVTVFIGRIVSQIHYFIDGLVSLAMCIVVCFGFMKCQYMWADGFIKTRQWMLRSKYSLIFVTALISLTLAGYYTHAAIEIMMGQ